MDMRSIVAELRRRCNSEGRPAVAKSLNCSESYLSYILSGQRRPGVRLLQRMGYKVEYQPTNGR